MENLKLRAFENNIRGKRVAVIGLGVSNIPLIDYLYDLMAKVTVFDERDIEDIDEDNLQSQEASIAVSIAGGTADNSHLYVFGKNLINTYKEKFNVIVSGRDLMNIYPNLDYHFFITASLEERIKRKMIQYGNNAKYEEIKQNIIARDDLQEKAGYYNIYNNTIEIDVTDCKSAKESAKKILSKIN